MHAAIGHLEAVHNGRYRKLPGMYLNYPVEEGVCKIAVHTARRTSGSMLGTRMLPSVRATKGKEVTPVAGKSVQVHGPGSY